MKKRFFMLLAVCCLSLGLLVGCTDKNNNTATNPENGTTDDTVVDELEDVGDEIEDNVTDDDVTNDDLTDDDLTDDDVIDDATDDVEDNGTNNATTTANP